MKNLILLLSASFFALSSFAQISGVTKVCVGSYTILSDTASSGTWSSSNTSVATLASGTGFSIVYGAAAGTTAIWFTPSCCTGAFSVNVTVTNAGVISGDAVVCTGSTLTLSDLVAVSSGTWTSSNVAIATVSSTGSPVVVSGVAAGTVYIYYNDTAGCSIYQYVQVTNCGSLSPITGASTMCLGATTQLSDATPGGTWASSNTAIATVSSAGLVYTNGSTVSPPASINILYSASGFSTGHTITFTSNAGSISGVGSTYAGGGTAPLYESASGGTWSSGNTAIATIDPSTGVYTGVSAGSDTISYIVPTCSGTGYAQTVVTVTAINGISGHVNFTGSPYTGTLKVWLITYNPSTLNLAAVDSATLSCSSSTSAYYQFVGPVTDSYRVKAAAVYTSSVTTGYMPTYHTSNSYWNTANVINHTTGTADINEDINMLTGTPTTGPGFIAGNVTTGANRGTSTTGIPSVGLNVYLFNSSTSTIMQLTATNASGNYSFSNLPLGTYYVFPDSLNYLTTAYTGITLTSGSPSVSSANFEQHTISKTITPVTTSVNNINNFVPSILIYPNPTHNTLTIASTNNITNITITNIVGQTVYTHEYNVPQVQVSVATLPSGVYFVKVNGTDVRKFVKE